MDLSSLFISIDTKNGLVYAGWVSVDSDEEKKNFVEYVKNTNYPNKIELTNYATITLKTIEERMAKEKEGYDMAVKKQWAISYDVGNIYIEPNNLVHVLTKREKEEFDKLCKRFSKP